MRLQGQGCSKLMASEFAGARPSAIRQKRHVDPGEPSCSPCSAAARPVYSDVVAAADTDTLPPNSLRTRRRMQYCRHRRHVCQPSRDQEEFYAHSHEVSGEPQNTPGVLDEQRLTVSTAQRQGPEPDVKPPETQPGEAPAPEVTSPFAPHASAAPAPVPPESEAPCGGRRDARYRASPGGGDNAGKDDPAVPRTLLRLAFGRLVAIAEK